MTSSATTVIQLPTQMIRYREADRILERWCYAQSILCRAERLTALQEVAKDMRKFKRSYYPSLPC